MISVFPAMAGPAAASVAPWLCLDIETTAGRPESAEEFMRRQWAPDSRWTPETIGKRYLEALAKKREKLALLDSAGIAVVALNTAAGRMILHALGEQPETVTDYARVQGFKDERSMLVGLRHVLVGWCDEGTLLVGHNLKSFDLPRLRLAFLRARLQLPPALGVGQPNFDTMREFCRSFSVERSEMVGLEEVLGKLGLQSHKGLVNGAQIGDLIANGEMETVLRYAALDVMAESEVFLRLTGGSASLE